MFRASFAPPARLAAFAAACGVVALLVSCTAEEPAPIDRTGPISIATTFYPTTYFAERIAGQRGEVTCPVPEDADPIFWNPDDASIAKYQQAELIVFNGAGFEKWREKVSLPKARIVDTAASFEKQFIEYEEPTTHSHGPEGEHTHAGTDGHTWLDPILAIEQAKAIAAACSKARPQWSSEFDDRLAALVSDLEDLDQRLRSTTAGAADRWVYASHPAYNYVGRRYRWKLVNLDLDPETVPDAATLAEIGSKLVNRPAKFLLWESEPTGEVAAALQALGFENVVISPVEGPPPAGESYLSIMKSNTAKLGRVFGS